MVKPAYREGLSERWRYRYKAVHMKRFCIRIDIIFAHDGSNEDAVLVIADLRHVHLVQLEPPDEYMYRKPVADQDQQENR